MVKKNKKNIKDIQDALLSNAGFINKSQQNADEPEAAPSVIDEDILLKIEALAEFEKVTTQELINKALSHFLRLKSFQVEQALKAKNK